MEKLYYENVYEKEFTAEIINVLEKDNKYHVELDKTYFYPAGDEQPGDEGYINGVSVIQVYEEDKKVYHVLENKPLKIHKVKCSIDWEKKYEYMQQHLGQHILSGCCVEILSANTLKVELGKEASYIELDKVIGDMEIKRVEAMANKIILENQSVEAVYLSNAELKKLSLKKIHLKSGEKIRILKIGEVDVRPCNGIHPCSTIEVQSIKITLWENQGMGTRIHFICGSRAISDYFSKSETVEKMSKLLKCKEEALAFEVERRTTELNKVLAEKRALKEQVANFEVQNILNSSENIKDIRVSKIIYEGVDLKYVTLLASKLVSFPKVILLFGAKLEEKAQLIFMCSKDVKILSMNSLLKDAITLIDGKGGGSDFSAQGAGKNNNNLDSCLEYAYNKVKESL